jgi:hypothetical protein
MVNKLFWILVFSLAGVGFGFGTMFSEGNG